MTASTRTAPHRWFHGTTAQLFVGDTLVNAAERGWSPHDDGDEHPEAVAHRALASRYVWVTDDLVEAAYFAAVATMRDPEPGATPRIVEVACEPEPGDFDDGYRCAAATVVGHVALEECAAAAAEAADAEPDPAWVLEAWSLPTADAAR